MKAQDYVGKYCHHQTHGEMFVDELPARSRTFVLATITDRGPGWDERTQSYKGHSCTIKDSNGQIVSASWSRGENREFGNQHLVHIKDLTPIEDETNDSE